MENNNQILDVLRLYEYAISIGKSLDYYDNCNQFLKLLLKRKNLNACWLIHCKESNCSTEYSIPYGNQIKANLSKKSLDFLNNIDTYILTPYNNDLKDLTTIDITEGQLAIYRLKSHGFLFLYSKGNNMCQKDLSQLLPVINKFATTLEACKAHENQQKLLKKLEERNKELNNYAHVVSHDLKSPLRNIDALVNWIKEDHSKNLNSDAIKQLNAISDNITRMESLVSGILQYSSIGLKDFNTSSINLNVVIKEVLNHIFIPKNIEIKTHKNFPNVNGDNYRLQQLFQNLISNAIKYNNKENGLIEIGYSITNNQHVYFVKDNGKGIPPKYHKKIFNVFQKLEASKNSTGIGLSIVEKIVENYNGNIWLSSVVNEGTTFYFTLN